MDGDIAKLPEIVISEEYYCFTYVDDAHGSSVLGSHDGVPLIILICMVKLTLLLKLWSKIGVVGGYVSGKKK